MVADRRALQHSSTVAYISRTNKINKQRAVATATTNDADDPRFRPTLSTTNPDRRERFRASESPIQTNNQPINQPTKSTYAIRYDVRYNMRYDMRHTRPPQAGTSKPAAVAFACDRQ